MAIRQVREIQRRVVRLRKQSACLSAPSATASSTLKPGTITACHCCPRTTRSLNQLVNRWGLDQLVTERWYCPACVKLVRAMRALGDVPRDARAGREYGILI